MSFLEEMAAGARRRVEERRREVPLAALMERCPRAPAPVDALARLECWPAEHRAVIAEIKRVSPARGRLAPHADAASLARVYAGAGAFAISVLTEPDRFGGSLADLIAVRAAVTVPVLLKDFVVDPYQLWEARVSGADLALLIVALLGGATGDLIREARECGLQPLVEVHDEAELAVALTAGADLVGVNHRDMRTLEVDLAVGDRLLPLIPPGVAAVAASGLRGSDDLERCRRAGADAFLIGEHLVRAPDPGAVLRHLIAGAPVRIHDGAGALGPSSMGGALLHPVQSVAPPPRPRGGHR